MPKPDSIRRRTLPTRPMLLPYLLPFRASDGAICLLSPQRNLVLRLPKSLARVLDRVLARLDGKSSVPEIVEAVRADLPGTEPEMVDLILHYLLDQRVLVDAAARGPKELDEYSRTRWDRNLSFFMSFETGQASRFDYQAALQDSSVAIIGVGGTGGWAAYNLAMAGVGRIVGVDGDSVSLSNLNRQILYRPPDIGKPKPDAAARELASVSPTMKFEGVARYLMSEEQVAQVIEGCDIVIMAGDLPQGLLEQWVNAACFALRIPYVTVGLQGLYGVLGPLYVPGVTGCWMCTHMARQKSKYYRETFEALTTWNPGGQPSIAPMCSLVGGIAAYEAIKYLAGFVRPALLGREMKLDTTTMSSRWSPVKQRGDCPVCHVPKEETPPRAIRLAAAPKPDFWSRWLFR